MNRKIEKIKRILKDEDMKIIITPNAAFLDGDAFEVVVGIQKVLRGILEDGFPKGLAKSLIELAFMSDEELEKEHEKQSKKLEKNLEKLTKSLEKINKEKK